MAECYFDGLVEQIDFCIALEVFDRSLFAVVYCKNLLDTNNRCFVAVSVLVVLQMIVPKWDMKELMVQIPADMSEVVLIHNWHNYHHSVECMVVCR